MDIKIIGENLLFYRNNKHLTQAELGDLAKVAPSTINLIENCNKERIQKNTIKKLAKALNVIPDLLYKIAAQSLAQTIREPGQQYTFIPLPPTDVLFSTKIREVPLLNSIPAGEGIDFTDQDYPVGFGDGTASTTIRDLSAYALTVQGDSMEPEIMDGATVIVSPNADLHDNCIVVYRLQNGDAGVKRYKRVGDQIHLIPENPKYEIQVLHVSEFVRVDKVAESLKKH